MAKSLQEISGFTDFSREINNGETAFISPIWHELYTFIAYI